MDHHATCPEDNRVTEFCARFRKDACGNASSPHLFGAEAAEAVDTARGSVAYLLKTNPKTITFLSGATEGNNLALRGVKLHPAKSDIITTSIEHSSVLEVVKKMGSDHNITIIPVGKSGIVNPDDIKRACTAKTGLISVQAANNEIGTIQPIKEISAIAKQFDAKLHVDCCQTYGRLPIYGDDADLITMSAHKIYGPKGIGALYVKDGVHVDPIIFGGSQENSLRPGTLNVPGIIGFGMAAFLMSQEWPVESVRLKAMRDELLNILMTELGEEIVHVNGDMKNRLPHNLNVTLMYVCPQKLNPLIRDVCAVSAASACRKSSTGSHVLAATGLPDNDTGAPIRFGLGHCNSMDEIRRVAACICEKAKLLYGVGCDLPSASVSATATSVKYG